MAGRQAPRVAAAGRTGGCVAHLTLVEVGLRPAPAAAAASSPTYVAHEADLSQTVPRTT